MFPPPRSVLACARPATQATTLDVTSGVIGYCCYCCNLEPSDASEPLLASLDRSDLVAAQRADSANLSDCHLLLVRPATFCRAAAHLGAVTVLGGLAL